MSTDTSTTATILKVMHETAREPSDELRLVDIATVSVTSDE